MTQNGSIREKKWSKWKFENFAIPLGPWVPDLVIFRRFSKMKTWSILSILAHWICSILHIMIVLIAINHFTSINNLAGWHNHAKSGQLCVKNGKILILDCLLISYAWKCLIMLNDSTYWSRPFDCHLITWPNSWSKIEPLKGITPSKKIFLALGKWYANMSMRHKVWNGHAEVEIRHVFNMFNMTLQFSTSSWAIRWKSALVVS